MAYTKIEWEDSPSIATPLSASNLNHMDEAIYANDAAIADKVDKVTGKGLSTNDYTDADALKLSGIEAGAEVNQNAFSNITVGNTTISASSDTDTFELEAGNNVTLTPDAQNKKIVIAATGGGGGGGANWGEIGGTLSNQTDLQNALNAKADAGTWLTATVAAQSNSVTFTSNDIHTTSILELYLEGTQMGFIDSTISEGSATFTFPLTGGLSRTAMLWVRNLS